MADRRQAALILLALTLALGACRSVEGIPITTAAHPVDLWPAPVAIPENPLQLVTMAAGPKVLDEAHLDFMESQADYVEGSARSLATYPGIAGPLVILAWDSIDLRVGVITCITTAPPDTEPVGGWGCGSQGEQRPFSFSGYGQSAGGGSNEFMVQHSPDAVATVIELDDRSTIVIRPGNLPISFHRWDGPAPVRFTMFWKNGTITSEVLTTIPG